jgi:hypothetical protein
MTKHPGIVTAGLLVVFQVIVFLVAGDLTLAAIMSPDRSWFDVAVPGAVTASSAAGIYGWNRFFAVDTAAMKRHRRF